MGLGNSYVHNKIRGGNINLFAFNGAGSYPSGRIKIRESSKCYLCRLAVRQQSLPPR
jgi:hypothetical protein